MPQKTTTLKPQSKPKSKSPRSSTPSWRTRLGIYKKDYDHIMSVLAAPPVPGEDLEYLLKEALRRAHR